MLSALIAVRHCHESGTSGRILCVFVIFVQSTNANRVYARRCDVDHWLYTVDSCIHLPVHPTIIVATIAHFMVVSTCEYKNASFCAPSLGDAVDESLFGDIRRSNHSPASGWWSIATAIDGHDLVFMGQRTRLVGIIHFTLRHDAQTCDF